MRRATKTLAITTLAVFLTSPARAAVCASVSAVLDGFKDKFGEVPAFVGTVVKPAGLLDMMIVVNPKTKTWTFLVYKNADTLCSIDLDGRAWTVAPDEEPSPIVPQMYILPDGVGGFRYFIPVGFP